MFGSFSYWAFTGTLYLCVLTYQDYKHNMLVDDRKNYFMLGATVALVSLVNLSLWYLFGLLAFLLLFQAWGKKQPFIVGVQAPYIRGRVGGVEVNDDEKQVILSGAQNLRYYVNKTYVAYRGIMPNLPGREKKKEPENDVLKAHKEKINAVLVVDRGEAELYLIALNSFIATDIMKSLLQDSEGIVANLYAS